MNKFNCVVVCLGCGSSAAADSQDSAWRKVRHEGHAHAQENASWDEAEAQGWAEETSPWLDD